MTWLVSLFARPRLRGWIVATVAISAAALLWIGYRAVGEWQHAAAMVAVRRAESAMTLLMTALTRDMRGAQTTVLSSADRDGLTLGPPIDLMQPIASGLARYPYVDAFFAWSEQRQSDPVVFYVRESRRPTWLAGAEANGEFPVVIGRAPAAAMALMRRVRTDAAQGRRFSVFDLPIGAARYQVVTILSYADTLRERPSGVLGYMVNVAWARDHYFTEVAAEVANIEGANQEVRFVIGRTEVDAALRTSRARDRAAPMARRDFPMTFFDPLLMSIDPPKDLELTSGTVMAIADRDPTLATAESGARRTLILAGIMSVVLIVGLGLSLQAGLATARLAEMRSDFVSAVTHELKSPIANLRAIHETVASGRLPSEAAKDYAQMGVREATRLGRLVENLLAYARIADVADAYAFEAVSLRPIVMDSLKEFGGHLRDAGFTVEVDVSDALPSVRADPRAIELLLNNLVDNAIRYSNTTRHLTISAAARATEVSVSVADRGNGIAASDRAHVTRRFVRGRYAGASGTGLGLAIVARIVKDHRGRLEIDSTPGVGTTVRVGLPRWSAS